MEFELSTVYQPLTQNTSPADSSDFSDQTVMCLPPTIVEPDQLETWESTGNIDVLFTKVYRYFKGRGYWVIIIDELFSLATFMFVVLFAILLGETIDYCVFFAETPEELNQCDCGERCDIFDLGRLKHANWFTVVFFITFASYWLFQVRKLYKSLMDLSGMHLFFTKVLKIRDEDMQTLEWSTVVRKLKSIKQKRHLNVPEEIDELSLCKRITRKDNYMIALIHNNVLNFSLPFQKSDQDTLMFAHFTQSLQWNLDVSLMSFVFDENDQIRPVFLNYDRRHMLALQLRRRFRFMAVVNLLLSPVIFVFLLVYFAFMYIEEFHKNPAKLGIRQYSPHAKWKLREFDELPHHFEQRLAGSYLLADEYLNKFPQGKLSACARFVSFVSGSLAGTLFVGTFLKQEFLHFDLLFGQTTLWFMGTLSIVLAFSNSLIPKRETRFNPEQLLREIDQHLHFIPDVWKTRLRSDKTRQEFSQIYQNRILLFLLELSSIVTNPYHLWFSFSKSTEEILSFIQDTTQLDESIGNVCKFSQLSRNLELSYSQDSKMTSSYYNFKQQNPDWNA